MGNKRNKKLRLICTRKRLRRKVKKPDKKKKQHNESSDTDSTDDKMETHVNDRTEKDDHNENSDTDSSDTDSTVNSKSSYPNHYKLNSGCMGGLFSKGSAYSGYGTQKDDHKDDIIEIHDEGTQKGDYNKISGTNLTHSGGIIEIHDNDEGTQKDDCNENSDTNLTHSGGIIEIHDNDEGTTKDDYNKNSDTNLTHTDGIIEIHDNDEGAQKVDFNENSDTNLIHTDDIMETHDNNDYDRLDTDTPQTWDVTLVLQEEDAILKTQVASQNTNKMDLEDIKVEPELDIFVEEEQYLRVPNCNEDLNENEATFEEPLLEPRVFGKELIVYTTKVDVIWNKCRPIIGDVLETIERESKPVFIEPLIKKKRRKNFVRLNYFLDNLEKYNLEVNNLNENNPLSNFTHEIITQKKRKKKPKTNFVGNEEQTITIDDDEVEDTNSVTFIDSDLSTDDELLSVTKEKSDKKEIVSVTVPPKPQSNILVIVNNSPLRTKASYRVPNDNYVINNEGNILEHNIHTIHFDIVNTYISDLPLLVNNCCWYTRIKAIKQALPDLSPTNLAFMRKSHMCDPTKCRCCCRREYSKEKQSERGQQETIEIKRVRNYFQNRWHQRLLSQNMQQNQISIINKALCTTTTRYINQNQTKEGRCPVRYINLNICNDQKCCYYIDKNGSINTFVKILNPSDPVCNYFTNMMGFINHLQSDFVTEYICCLEKYKNFVLKLAKTNKNIAKFITNAHSVSPNKCVRCENSETAFNRKVCINIPIPKYPKHTKKYNRNRKNVKHRNKTTNITTVIHTNIIQSNTTKNTNLEKPSNVVKISKDKNSHFKNFDFENVQLVITPGGKAEIQTKCVPEKICPENLKILKHVLRYTNEKLALLNINVVERISICNLFPKRLKNTIETTTTQQEPKKYINTKNTSGKKVSNDDRGTASHKNILQPIALGRNIKPDNKLYNLFTNINAYRRTQYLISHERITHEGIDLWMNVNMSENSSGPEKPGRVATELPNARIPGSATDRKDNKRKSVQNNTSIPSKQRKESTSERSVAPNESIVPVPSSSHNKLLRDALLTPITTPKIIAPSSLNAPVRLQNEVVTDVGKISMDVIDKLYNQCAILEPRYKEQIRIPSPVDYTQSAVISRVDIPLTDLPENDESYINAPIVLPACDDPLATIATIEVRRNNKDEDSILGV